MLANEVGVMFLSMLDSLIMKSNYLAEIQHKVLKRWSSSDLFFNP